VVVDSVVVGRIKDVQPATGYIESGEAPTADKPSSSLTDFDDSEADWRNLQVTVEVEEVLRGAETSTVVIDWPITGSTEIGDDWEAVARGLRDLGPILLSSTGLPSSREYAGLTRVALDRPYSVAQVDPSGTLNLPFADGADGPSSRRFLDEVDTLDEVRSALK
jgi:hypothetical protein